MRDFRWQPSGRSLVWGALGGLIASILIGFAMQGFAGALTEDAAQLVGSDTLAAGWMVHIAAGVLAGTLYGAFARTLDAGRGFWIGAQFGAALGIVGPWMIQHLLTDGGVPLDAHALAIVVLHACWGAILGVTHALGLRETTTGLERRRVGRPI